MRQFVTAAALAGLVLAPACATVQPTVDLPTAEADALRNETVAQQSAALERLREHHQRVATMAHRLVTANVDLCPRRGPAQGFTVFQTRQLPRELRGAARDVYGVTDDVSVFTVVEGSAAQRAGVRPGQRIVAVNGERLRSTGGSANSRWSSGADAERAQERLERAFDRGAVRLLVSDAGGEREVTVQGEPACDYDVLLFQSDDVNAAADGEDVAITTGMARYAQSDEELALVVGHEIAHNAMRHRDRLAASTRLARVGGLLGSILIGAATGVSVDLYSLAARGNKQTRLTLEREADYVGMYFAARAGYDVSKAQSFWRRLGADYPSSTYTRFSHPGSPERTLNITATAEEIAAKRATKLALTPTPAKLEQLERATTQAVAQEDKAPAPSASAKP
jgi:hypothetical protein